MHSFWIQCTGKQEEANLFQGVEETMGQAASPLIFHGVKGQNSSSNTSLVDDKPDKALLNPVITITLKPARLT